MLPVWQVGKFSLPAFALDYTLLSVCLQTSAWMSGHHQVLIKCCLSHRARLLNIKGCNANRLSTYRRFVHLYQELYRSMVHPAGHGESGEWWRDGELSWGKWMVPVWSCRTAVLYRQLWGCWDESDSVDPLLKGSIFPCAIRLGKISVVHKLHCLQCLSCLKINLKYFKSRQICSFKNPRAKEDEKVAVLCNTQNLVSVQLYRQHCPCICSFRKYLHVKNTHAKLMLLHSCL